MTDSRFLQAGEPAVLSVKQHWISSGENRGIHRTGANTAKKGKKVYFFKAGVQTNRQSFHQYGVGLAELSAWLKTAIEKLSALKDKEAPQPTILDFVHAYEDMRKSGRVNWSVKGKQTAAINDVKFAARVFAWMQTTGIYTLDDFNVTASEHNADFARLAGNAKTVRRPDTALKHIDTVVSLKPVYGYMRDPKDKEHWIPDPEAAPS